MEGASVQFVANVFPKYQITLNRHIRGMLKNQGIEVRPGDQIELAFVRKINGGGQIDNKVTDGGDRARQKTANDGGGK